MATKKIIKKSDVDEKILTISETISGLKNSIITPNDVRLALMDFPECNIPLYKEHLDDEKIWKCIEWGVGYFNDYPPTLSSTYTAETFPRKKLLLDLAVIEALRLISLIELRGEMQYSDGGVQSTVFYKSQHFGNLRQEMKQAVDQEMISVKRSLNINECYGVLC